MNFLHRTPFFRLLLPLTFGIIISHFLNVPLYVLAFVSLVALIFIATDFFIKNINYQFRFRWIFGLGLTMLILSFGIFLSQQRTKITFPFFNQRKIYSAEIQNYPEEKANSYLLQLDKIQLIGHDSIKSLKGGAIIYVSKQAKVALLKPGDQLMFQGQLSKPEGVINPDGFDYAAYLKRKGIYATAFVPDGKWKIIGHDSRFSLQRLALESQRKLLHIYQKAGIKGKEFAVLSALTLGYKEKLDPELKADYSSSGAMHILAVSGLHVGIIYMVLGFLLAFMNRRTWSKIMKIVLVVLFLWTYAFITGLSPSVVRSTLMFTLIAIGTSLERKAQIYNTLSVTAFFMLIVDPQYLFDVGFQLSFCAVTAIVYFQPKLSRLFYIRLKPLKWLWELTAVSLAAQIGTAPLMLFYFHQFPNYFFITNLIAIPMATIILYVAIALIVVSPVSFLFYPLGFVLKYLLLILNKSISVIHHLPHSVSVIPFNQWQVLTVFLAVVFFSVYLAKKKFHFLFISLAGAFCLFFIVLVQNYRTLNSSKMVVYADGKNTSMELIDGKNHYVLSTDSASMLRNARNFWILNLLNKPQKLKNQKWFLDNTFSFYSYKVYILLDDELNDKKASKSLLVDYMIIGNHCHPKIAKVLKIIRPKEIIVDKTISKWYVGQIKKTCSMKNIRFYSVAENNAFVCALEN